MTPLISNFLDSISSNRFSTNENSSFRMISFPLQKSIFTIPSLEGTLVYSNELILFTPVQSLTKHSRQARVIFDESVDIPYSEYKLYSSSHSATNNRQSKTSYPLVIPNPQPVASNSLSNVILIGLNVNLT